MTKATVLQSRDNARMLSITAGVGIPDGGASGNKGRITSAAPNRLQVASPDDEIGAPLRFELEIRPGDTEIPEQGQSADQGTRFGRDKRAEYRSGDAEKQERGAPDGRKSAQPGEINCFHVVTAADGGALSSASGSHPQRARRRAEGGPSGL